MSLMELSLEFVAPSCSTRKYEWFFLACNCLMTRVTPGLLRLTITKMSLA